MLKNTKSNLIRCTIFLLILGIIFFYLNQVFSIAESEESKKNFNQFYNEKENSLDGIFFGASSVNRYWVAAKAYHDTGIAVYNLGTTSQPLVVVKSLMEEAAKSQNPKVFIVELRWLVRTADRIEEAFIRKVTDSMHFSATRIQAVNESVDYALQGDNDVVDNKIDYYIPILKYHGRWAGGDLTTDDLRIDKSRTLCNHLDKYHNVRQFIRMKQYRWLRKRKKYLTLSWIIVILLRQKFYLYCLHIQLQKRMLDG